MSSAKSSRTGWSAPRRMFRFAAYVYIGVSAWLYVFQDQLLFRRMPLAAAEAAQIARSHPEAEAVSINVDPGVTLRGWLVPGAGASPHPLLIYFGGNEDEVSWMLDKHAQFPGWSLLLVNYRGYGLSNGEPSEAALLTDDVKLFDWVAARVNVDRHRIVAMGRSLGTGVAVHLASQRPLAGVILITPYDSMVAVAQVHYPLLPVGLLLRHRFDSLSRARGIDIPMLALVAEEDEVIPPIHAQSLQAAWAGPTLWQLIADADHASISRSPVFWQRIRDFLDGLGQTAH
jgi:uncharacterized protein